MVCVGCESELCAQGAPGSVRDLAGGVEAGARGSQKPLQSRGVGCWDPELLSAAVDGLGGREERGQVRGVVPEEDGWVTTWLQSFAFQSPGESGLG